MSIVGLEIDLFNYSGRKDFQVVAEYVDKRHFNVHVRRLDSTKEGWTENLKVLANFYDLETTKTVIIGSCKLATSKCVGVEVDFDIEKSQDPVTPFLQPYSLPAYPGAQQISRKQFNTVFKSNIVTLPTNLFAVGLRNGNVYTYNEGYELLFQIELTIKNIICVALEKNLFSEFYFIICADDGYMEYHYPSERTEAKQIGEKDLVGQRYVKLDNPAEYAVLHQNKYILAQNNQVGTPNTLAVPDRYYFYLNRYNEYRSIHEGLPFKTKKAEMVYGSNPRGNKFIFTKRRDIDISPREYLYSDAVDKRNLHLPKWIKRSDMIRYKYILDIDGNASTWDATAWKLNSGSVILKTDSCWNQWFFDKYKAWEHYVPVKDDMSDLQQQFEWCEAHQAECEQMIRRCKQLFQEVYRFHNVMDYVVQTLQTITSAKPYEVNGRRIFLFHKGKAPAADATLNLLTGSSLTALTKVCKVLRSDDIIVFIHSTSNIDFHNFSPADFLERFLSYGKKIVLASEKNLWPENIEGIRYKLIGLAPETCEYKYLQAGILSAEAGELARLLDERVFDPDSEPNEQEYLSRAYVTEHYDMTLDYKCKLSISTFKCSAEEIAAAKTGGVPFVNWNAGR